jgi:hypothetical protein
MPEIPCHQGNTRFFKNGGKTAGGSSMLTFQSSSLPARHPLKRAPRRRSGAVATKYELASISRRLELSAQLFARVRANEVIERSGAKGEVIGASAN